MSQADESIRREQSCRQFGQKPLEPCVLTSWLGMGVGRVDERQVERRGLFARELGMADRPVGIDRQDHAATLDA